MVLWPTSEASGRCASLAGVIDYVRARQKCTTNCPTTTIPGLHATMTGYS